MYLYSSSKKLKSLLSHLFSHDIDSGRASLDLLVLMSTKRGIADSVVQIKQPTGALYSGIWSQVSMRLYPFISGMLHCDQFIACGQQEGIAYVPGIY